MVSLAINIAAFLFLAVVAIAAGCGLLIGIGALAERFNTGYWPGQGE